MIVMNTRQIAASQPFANAKPASRNDKKNERYAKNKPLSQAL